MLQGGGRSIGNNVPTDTPNFPAVFPWIKMRVGYFEMRRRYLSGARMLPRRLHFTVRDSGEIKQLVTQAQNNYQCLDPDVLNHCRFPGFWLFFVRFSFLFLRIFI